MEQGRPQTPAEPEMRRYIVKYLRGGSHSHLPQHNVHQNFQQCEHPDAHDDACDGRTTDRHGVECPTPLPPLADDLRIKAATPRQPCNVETGSTLQVAQGAPQTPPQAQANCGKPF